MRAAILFALALAAPAGAAPIVTVLSTTDLNTALGYLDTQVFSSRIRWDSASTANWKLWLSSGTTGGSGITWNTNGPQTFTFSYVNGVATTTVVDGGSTFSISSTFTGSGSAILIGVRANGNSSINASNLTIDGTAISPSSLGLANTGGRSFLLVTNLGGNFNLSGLLAMASSSGGSGGEIPALQIWVGSSPFSDPLASPEPAPMLLAGLGLVALATLRRRAAAKAS